MTPSTLNEKTVPNIEVELIPAGNTKLSEGVHGSASRFPMTSGQQGIYLDFIQRPSLAYNVPAHYTFPAAISAAQLADALKAIVVRHPAFFMRAVPDSLPLQMQQGAPFIPEIPVRVVEKTLEASELVCYQQEFIRPFDLHHPPLFRFEILVTPEATHLFVDIHHIIGDGASLQLLGKQLQLALEGKALLEENIPFSDLALAEHNADHALAKSFYEQRFAGVETDSNLLTDYPSEGKESECREMRVAFAVSPQEIQTFVQAKGVSEGSFFLAAFGYALARFTGQDESLFCTVTGNRHKPERRNTFGMLVSTLPVWIKIDETKPVDEFLKATQSDFFATLKHASYPFAEIVRTFDIRPDILFAWQGEIYKAPELNGKKIQFEKLYTESAVSKLTVRMFRCETRYEISLVYRRDLYHAETIARFAEGFESIVSGFLRYPRLQEIPLQSTSDSRLIEGFNASDMPFDDTRSLVDLLREQAQKTPDQPAIRYRDVTFSYQEYDALSDRIAAQLARLGAGRNEVVAILLPRCEWMPVAALAALKTGAAYQPLDPSYPPERLAFMLQDSGAKILLAERDLLSLVPDFVGPVLATDEFAALPNATALPSAPAPEGALVLLYTSGSTGVPKGCILEHRNLLNFCHCYVKKFQLDEHSRVAAYASFGFDANLMDTWPTLISGATLHILAEDIRLDLPEMEAYFVRNGITHAFMTTQVGRQFALQTKAPALRYLLVGGETLTPLQPPKHFAFINVYGPTECTILSTAYPFIEERPNIPIGGPLANTRLYVVDKQHRPLPIGVPGELLIAGRQVARGYLNRPEQNEKVFIANPFSQEPGFERVYKTGDIVRWLPDGNIEFVGRRDHQVKIRGFRIELTEVEKVIRDFPGITDATVVALDAPGGGKMLAAYVVSPEKVDIAALNAFILETKPPYMQPAATLQIDKIPLNVNSKVDKRKLPEIRFATEEESEGENRPLSRLETILHEMIAEVLGHQDFGLSRPLSRAGLSSLSAIRLATLLHKRFGFAPAVNQILKDATLLSLADTILERLLMPPKATEIRTEKSGQQSHYPLSASQQGVYYDAMKRPQTILYNIPMRLSLAPATDARKLAAAIVQTVLAHPYLATRLEMRGGEVVQRRVAPKAEDISVPVLAMNAEELATFRAEFVRPFMLLAEPLYRFALARSEDTLSLFMDMHHLLFDGASAAIFLQDVMRAYAGETLEAETYSAFEHVQDNSPEALGERYNEARNWFANEFSGFDGATEIPADKEGKPEEGRIGEVSLLLDDTKFTAFCRANGLSLAQLFLAATAYAGLRFAGAEEICLVTISNGRTDLRLAQSVGMFVNTLPLRIRLTRRQTALQFVTDAGLRLRTAITHECYPFSTFVAEHGLVPQLFYACQLGVLAQSRQVLSGELEPLKLEAPKFKVSVSIDDNPAGGMCIRVRYNDALYGSQRMDHLARAIATAARNIVETAQAPIERLSLLDAALSAQIASFRVAAEASIPENRLHKVFERHVALAPEKIALIATDATMSFAELNACANRLANGLLASGAKPRDRIAFLLPRTSRMTIAQYGILKAGCAFIPLDPAYPQERIAHILDDSAAACLITTADRLADFPGKSIDVETLLAHQTDLAPEIEVAPTDCAYVIYTSGSTGQPKGVMLTHQGISNYVCDHPANIHIHAAAQKARRLLSITTVSFDMSLKETAVALCNGVTLVLANENEANDPLQLAALFERTGADAFNATPSRLQQLLALPALQQAISRCTVIMCGAEKYPPNLLSHLRSITQAQIFNSYGPTEITVSSNAKNLTNSDVISIGRPLLNYTADIVDSDGNALPPGVVGELYIGGPGVALGYVNLPEKTAESFIDYHGERVYRSGDFAQWLENGDVALLGRKDNQVKLRGLRIELNEIENRLAACPGVQSAAVRVRSINHQEQLCAWYSAAAPLDAEVLRKKLQQELPVYMIPSLWMQLETLPLNANGKLNVRALPDPVASGRTNVVIAAASPTEARFCEIFAHILELPQVSADADFFELGGSSLMVTRVVIEAAKSDLSINYSDLFSHPSPQKLARLVCGEAATTHEKEVAYNYAPLHELLAENTLDALRQGEKLPLGNVLLTGATGFLGIHVLDDFLRTETGKIWCVLRGDSDQDATERLQTRLFYYFEKNYAELLGQRLFVLHGDLTDDALAGRLESLLIDTVFNCAAVVKHFARGDEIADVNLNGVQRLIEFCQKKHARLVHISTTSVAGYRLDGLPPPETQLTEQTLYFGQNLDNKYIDSKFLAERALLEAARNGLCVKILRAGNLCARQRDGEFQINFTTNAFMGRLKAWNLIGAYPFDGMEMPVDLTPIDSAARAALLLAQTPAACRVFHLSNNHAIPIGDIITSMNALGFAITPQEQEVFSEALEKAKEDPAKAQILASLIAYQDSSGQRIIPVGKNNLHSVQTLRRLGFSWPMPSQNYLERFLLALRGLGYFE